MPNPMVAEWAQLPENLRPSVLWPRVTLGWLAIVGLLCICGYMVPTSWEAPAVLIVAAIAWGLYKYPERLRRRALKNINDAMPAEWTHYVSLAVLRNGTLIGTDVGVVGSANQFIVFQGLQTAFSLPRYALDSEATWMDLGRQTYDTLRILDTNAVIAFRDYGSKKGTSMKLRRLLEDATVTEATGMPITVYPPSKFKVSARISPWPIALGLLGMCWSWPLLILAWRTQAWAHVLPHAVVAFGELGGTIKFTSYYLKQRRLQKAYVRSNGPMVASEA